MEANIFQLECTLKEAKEFLVNEGYEKISNEKKNNFERDINKKNVKAVINSSFYYKSTPKDHENITWLEEWKSFFNLKNLDSKFFSLHYGAILISLDKKKYIISYGRSHQTIQRLSNINFGLDIAERIIDASNIQVKNSSFINNKKNREYTQFKNNGFLLSKIGESNNQIIGDIQIDIPSFKLNKYKNAIKFSSSIKISNANLSNTDLIELVGELHFIEKLLKPRVPLPRMELITDKRIINILNRELIKNLHNKNLEKFTLVHLIEDGNEFGPPFEDEKIFLHSYKPYPLSEYNLELIINIISENQLENVNSITIINASRSKIYQLLKIIDFSVLVKGITYSLFEGKWAKLNHSFMDFLNSQVEYVNGITTFDKNYDFTDDVLLKGTDLMNKKPEYDKVKYGEYPYNIYFENKNNLTLLDRKSDHVKFKKIEFADLYNKTSSRLTHVKIGETSQFRACISQSSNSSRIYSTDTSILKEYKIENVKEIEMIFVTDLKSIINDNKVDFNKSMSVNFKLELVNWFQYIKELNYIPKITLSQDLRTKK